MQLAEYIQAIEKPIKKDEVREINLSDLYAHFKAGYFTPAQVLEFYRQRDSPRFIEAVKKFEVGKLFIAQMQSFESWQHHDYAKEDRATADVFLSLENSAQQRHDGIRNFIAARIFGKRNDQHNEEKFKQEWIRQNNNFNWIWNT